MSFLLWIVNKYSTPPTIKWLWIDAKGENP
jgi:hypothetical protein